MKLEKEPNNIESFRTRMEESDQKKRSVQRAIKTYFDEYGIEPNMETLSQITGKSITDLRKILKQIDLYRFRMYNLEKGTGSPERFSLFHLETNDKHKTYFLYDNTLKKYLPMRILDIIHYEKNKNSYFDRGWIKNIIIEVEYPESGWTALIIPDSEIYKYYSGRVVVNFVDLPNEAFDTLEEALEAIKIWKTYSVKVTDKPDGWSGFSNQKIKTTDITAEVSAKLPGQIEIEKREWDSKTTDIKGDKEILNNQVKMDEVIFAKNQQKQCTFGRREITYDDYISITRKTNKFGIDQLNFSEKIKLAFMMTFGLHKESKNLDKALSIAENLLNLARGLNPFEDLNDELSDPYFFYEENGLDKNDIYLSWLNNIGHLSVLIGTIYAYKNEVIKSCYFFMQGLKTEMLVLSDEYYNFIDYMLKKLYDMPKLDYSQDPVKYIYHGNNMVPKELQKRIISDFVNDNSDTIIAHYHNQKLFGYLSQMDKDFYDLSTSNYQQNQRLFGYLNQNEDNICETWIITNEFKLKSIKFELITKGEPVFYDSADNFPGISIEGPDSFRIKRNSALLNRNLYFKSDFSYYTTYTGKIICSFKSTELKFHKNMHPIY